MMVLIGKRINQLITGCEASHGALEGVDTNQEITEKSLKLRR